MVHKRCCTLNTSICQIADLVRVEIMPFTAVELLIKVLDKLGGDEVDERVTYIAAVNVVDWQVEEVELLAVVFIQLLDQHFLCVLVWDVFDHQCGPSVVHHLFQVEFIVFFLLSTDCLSLSL